MKWILIFGFLINVVLLLFRKGVFFLSGVDLRVIMPFLLLICIGTITFLLVSAIKLYRSRNLKGQITILQGFYFLFATFVLGVITFLIINSFLFIEDLQNVPRRYYSVDVDPNSLNNNISWFSIFINDIKEMWKGFVLMAIISFIIAKIFSRSTPSV